MPSSFRYEVQVRFIASLIVCFVLQLANTRLHAQTNTPPPTFSRPGGTFTTLFQLTLNPASPQDQIRYTTNGGKPTAASTLYTGPITIDTTVLVRAIAMRSGLQHSQSVSEGFIALGSDIQSFSSNLPLVVMSTFGGGIDANTLKPAYGVIMDTQAGGRASITGPAEFTGRIALKIRGSSSATFPKKKYKMETWNEDDEDRSVSLLDLPSSSDWNLNMSYVDKTLIRDFFPDLWMRKMKQYGVRSKFVEVFLQQSGGSGGGGLELIQDDFTASAGDMPAHPSSGQGSPIPSGGFWTNYQLGDRVPNRFDGITHLQMPRVGDWNQYVDTRIQKFTPPANVPYTFLAIFTMPNNSGNQCLGFAGDPSWNQGNANSNYHRVFKLRNGSIYFSNMPASHPTTFNANDVDTGYDYIPGVPQGLKIAVDSARNIRLWYQNGNDKNPGGQGWADITPAGNANGLLTMGTSENMIGINNYGTGGGTFLLDYIALLPGTTPPVSGTVTMNDYIGTYLLMESYKIDPDRVNIAELDSATSTTPEVSGGYLMKFDRYDPAKEYVVSSTIHASEDSRIVVSDPNFPDMNPQQKNYISNFLASFETALNAANFTDPVNGYAKYIDTDSFVDYDIVQQLIKNNDTYRHSTYMFKDRNGKLVMGPLWDLDWSLAQTNSIDADNPANWWTSGLHGRWWARLKQDPDFMQLWIDHWAKYRRAIFSNASIDSIFQGYFTFLSETAGRNFEKWKVLGQNFYSSAGWQNRTTYFSEVDYSRSYAINRVAWIDSQFVKAPVFNMNGGTLAHGSSLTMSAPAGTIYYTLNGSDPRLWAVPNSTPTPTPTVTSSPAVNVPESASKRALVPTGDIGTGWLSTVGFNDSAWTLGTGGIGYENNSGYESYISLPLPEMFNNNATCYIRIPFTIAAGKLSEVSALTLRVRYDDGFAAWLNGTRVASGLAPASLQWNSEATTSHSDIDAVGFEDFDISPHIGQLQEGSNLLAIHGLNRAIDSSDMLISVEMTSGSIPNGGGGGGGGTTGGGISPMAISYSGPITINPPRSVFARAYNGGQWSAPVSVLFTTRDPAPGNVIVTEFLANANGNDIGKEWIELYNTTSEPIDLNGWELTDNGSDSHVIDNGGALIIPPASYRVIGAADDAWVNRGVPIDFAWNPDELTLGNGGDEIILKHGNDVIHAIGYEDYATSPTPVNGINLEARPGVALGMAADYAEGAVNLWQPQISSYGTNGDRGTPGRNNDGVNLGGVDVSAPQLVDVRLARRDLILLVFNEPLDMNTATSPQRFILDNAVGRPVSVQDMAPNRLLLQLGQLLQSGVVYTLTTSDVADLAGNPMEQPAISQLSFEPLAVSITEIMYNNRGDDLEWIELYNTGSAPIDISGRYLTDDELYPATGEGALLIPDGTILDPHEYVVVNLWADADFGRWQMPASVRVINATVLDSGRLSNGGDNIALFSAATGGVLIDGSLDVEFPDIALDGESIAKIDELFPWGDAETVAINYEVTREPIPFTPGVNTRGELLSDHATPGQGNPDPPSPLRNSIIPQHWTWYR